ncbi:MAG TPA: alpha/beta hydrolase-fold protein [Xanthobacteraceae bacterium]|nr:alpha/beta hydrolase-fold protein [Xanthobacteraceae bacterium]
MSEFSLAGTRRFELTAAASGAAYDVFLAVPDEPPPEAGFPVIYMLDADRSFATLVETLRRGAGRRAATGIEPAVAVGIAHPAGTARERRRLDYTPGPAAGEGGHGPCGGRDAFLRVIEQDLKPMVARQAPIDESRQALFGHSLAGYFVLDVLARDPAAFHSYIAVSPSVWWDRARLEAGLERTSPTPPVRLMVLVGEWEQALAPWQSCGPDAQETARRRARRAMVDEARDIAACAERLLGPAAQVRFQVLADEDHASILPAAMSRALRFALADDPAIRADATSGCLHTIDSSG